MIKLLLNATITVILIKLCAGCNTDPSTSSPVGAKGKPLSCTCEFDNGGKESFVATSKLGLNIEYVCQVAFALALEDACKNNRLTRNHRVKLVETKECKKYNRFQTQVCYTQDDWGI